MENKIYLSIAFGCFFLTSGLCQETRTLFYDGILYGKVQKVATAYYIPGTPGVDLTDTTLYDKQGNTLETRRTTRHGTFFDDRYIDKSDISGKKMEMTGNEKGQAFNLNSIRKATWLNMTVILPQENGISKALIPTTSAITWQTSVLRQE